MTTKMNETNTLSTVSVGIMSGLVSTGVNQVYKQIKER